MNNHDQRLDSIMYFIINFILEQKIFLHNCPLGQKAVTYAALELYQYKGLWCSGVEIGECSMFFGLQIEIDERGKPRPLYIHYLSVPLSKNHCTFITLQVCEEKPLYIH